MADTVAEPRLFAELNTLPVVGFSITRGKGASDVKLQTRYALDPISAGAGMRINFVRLVKEA